MRAQGTGPSDLGADLVQFGYNVSLLDCCLPVVQGVNIRTALNLLAPCKTDFDGPTTSVLLRFFVFHRTMIASMRPL